MRPIVRLETIRVACLYQFSMLLIYSCLALVLPFAFFRHFFTSSYFSITAFGILKSDHVKARP